MELIKVWYKNTRFCTISFFVEIKYDYFFPSNVYYIRKKEKIVIYTYHSKCRLGKSYKIAYKHVLYVINWLTNWEIPMSKFDVCHWKLNVNDFQCKCKGKCKPYVSIPLGPNLKYRTEYRLLRAIYCFISQHKIYSWKIVLKLY